MNNILDWTEEEIADLLKSGNYTIANESQLEELGYTNTGEEIIGNNGEFFNNDCYYYFLNCSKEKIETATIYVEDGFLELEDKDGYYQIPFEIIIPMDSYIEPIHLNIPDEKEILLI